MIARPRTAVSTTATLGTPRVGQRLRVTAPSATGYPQPRVAYQWLRNGRAIEGATGSTYRPRSVDRDRSLRCRITYANSAGTTMLKSSAVRIR